LKCISNFNKRDRNVGFLIFDRFSPISWSGLFHLWFSHQENFCGTMSIVLLHPLTTLGMFRISPKEHLDLIFERKWGIEEICILVSRLTPWPIIRAYQLIVEQFIMNP
jgi:hypothetical protein